MILQIIMQMILQIIMQIIVQSNIFVCINSTYVSCLYQRMNLKWQFNIIGKINYLHTKLWSIITNHVTFIFILFLICLIVNKHTNTEYNIIQTPWETENSEYFDVH